MSSFEKGHALLIGVGADLPCTVRDAEGLATVITDPRRCAYAESRVNVLTEKCADHQGVLRALNELAASCQEDSAVIVYFSGHGYQLNTAIGQAHFLLPNGYDVSNLAKTAISSELFLQKLRALPAQRVLLLLDCCHAGGIDDTKTPGIAFTKSPLPLDTAEYLVAGKGRVVIASSQADELSYAGSPYSAFTLALVEALAGHRVATRDGFVRVADLAIYTGAKVSERTNGRQNPILNFRQADNFAVAYYAGGDAEPKRLNLGVEPQIERSPGALNWADTGGGIQRGQIGRASEQPQLSKDRSVAIMGNTNDSIIVTGDGNSVYKRTSE